MVIKHKKFGEYKIVKDPLLQKDLEAYSRELRENGIELDKITGFELWGGVVRAVIKLDWLMPKIVFDELIPKKTRWLYDKIMEFIAEAITYDEKN